MYNNVCKNRILPDRHLHDKGNLEDYPTLVHWLLNYIISPGLDLCLTLK